MKKIDLYGRRLNCYKAALHTHSTISEDGIISPDELIRLYSQAGYDVLAFTDHRRMNPVSTYNGQGMTVISGQEIHPMRRVRGELWHILGLGLPQNFPEHFTRAKEAAQAVHDAGGLVFIPHPYWTGFGSKLLSSLPHVSGIEVFNGAVREVGKSHNMESWDQMLDMGRNYTALAVDDVHHDHDLFRGWTVICAEDKSETSILSALRNGDFYASCGPEFYSIKLENGIFEAEFSPAVSAQLCSNGRKGFQGHFETCRRGSERKSVTSLKIDVSSVKENFYIRCQITDAEGNMAWSNPIRRAGKNKKYFKRP